jgi:hypothetical protein
MQTALFGRFAFYALNACAHGESIETGDRMLDARRLSTLTRDRVFAQTEEAS